MTCSHINSIITKSCCNMVASWYNLRGKPRRTKASCSMLLMMMTMVMTTSNEVGGDNVMVMHDGDNDVEFHTDGDGENDDGANK